MTSAVEHLRQLNEGITTDDTEPKGMQHKTAGGTLFWMAYVSLPPPALSSSVRLTCAPDSRCDLGWIRRSLDLSVRSARAGDCH